MKELDCRKLYCPVPVVKTKKAIDEGVDSNLSVVVDNIPARDNVRRFAKNQGHEVDITDEGGGVFRLNITVNPAMRKKESVAAVALPSSGGFSVFITSDLLGVGDERLGAILMKAFLNTLGDSEPKPDKVIFMNGGVKLVVEGSEVLDSLEALENLGIEIYACGTCLNYYDLLEKRKFGIVSNMYEIVNLLLDAPKLITL